MPGVLVHDHLFATQSTINVCAWNHQSNDGQLATTWKKEAHRSYADFVRVTPKFRQVLLAGASATDPSVLYGSNTAATAIAYDSIDHQPQLLAKIVENGIFTKTQQDQWKASILAKNKRGELKLSQANQGMLKVLLVETSKSK